MTLKVALVTSVGHDPNGVDISRVILDKEIQVCSTTNSRVTLKTKDIYVTMITNDLMDKISINEGSFYLDTSGYIIDVHKSESGNRAWMIKK